MLAALEGPASTVHCDDATGRIEDGSSAGPAAQLDGALEVGELEKRVLRFRDEPEETALKIIAMNLRHVTYDVEIQDSVVGIGIGHEGLSGSWKLQRENRTKIQERGFWVSVKKIVGLDNSNVGSVQEMSLPDTSENYRVLRAEMRNKTRPESERIFSLQILDDMLCGGDESVAGDVETGSNYLEPFSVYLLQDGDNCVTRVHRSTISATCNRSIHASAPEGPPSASSQVTTTAGSGFDSVA